MEEMCTLNNLHLGTSAVVNSVECKDKLTNRIYDFGIIENSIIKPLFRSPFGDPTAYLVKNAVVALREKDSRYITVTPIK